MHERLDEPIEVVPYDPEWPIRFQQECERVRAARGPLAVAIEHTGSTSVPGLAAKPIVDLLVGLSQATERACVAAALAPLGYEDVGLYLRRRGSESFNVGLAPVGTPEWQDAAVFRDYLRAHPDEARTYAEVKLLAASRHGTLLAYAREKRAFIVAATDRARRWRDGAPTVRTGARA